MERLPSGGKQDVFITLPVWIRAVTGPGLEKQTEGHVTRAFGTLSPLSPFPAAVSGWHGDGWDVAADFIWIGPIRI